VTFLVTADALLDEKFFFRGEKLLDDKLSLGKNLPKRLKQQPGRDVELLRKLAIRSKSMRGGK
jgi:hypothetical protein